MESAGKSINWTIRIDQNRYRRQVMTTLLDAGNSDYNPAFDTSSLWDRMKEYASAVVESLGKCPDDADYWNLGVALVPGTPERDEAKPSTE